MEKTTFRSFGPFVETSSKNEAPAVGITLATAGSLKGKTDPKGTHAIGLSQSRAGVLAGMDSSLLM